MKPQPYHIAIIAPYAYQPFRSINQLAQLLCDQFQNIGCSASIVRPPSLFGDLSEGSGKLHQVLAGTERMMLSPARFAGKMAALKKSLKKQNKELIIVLSDQGLSHLVTGINNIKVVQVVNDLIAIRAANGEFDIPSSWAQRFSQSLNLNGLRYSNNFLVFSEASKADLLRYVPSIDSAKVKVAPLFAAHPYEPMPLDRLEALQGELWRSFKLSPQPYFLHVGSSAWYKNREGLIRLVGQLKKLRGNIPALVFAGAAPTQEMLELVEQNDIEFYHFANPSDEELNALYTGALATIMPSFVEGFCWPALEALQSASPLIISQTPCLEGGFGEASAIILPDPTGWDPHEWAQGCAPLLEDLLEVDDEVLDQVVQEGLAHAQQFNENRFAQTLQQLLFQE